jgi:hypothetical protein
MTVLDYHASIHVFSFTKTENVKRGETLSDNDGFFQHNCL